MNEDKFDERREIISQLELKLQALEARHKKLLETLKSISNGDLNEFGTISCLHSDPKRNCSKVAIEAIEADAKAGSYE